MSSSSTQSAAGNSMRRAGAGQRKIVVVEDERKIAELLRDYLEREDFRVIILERGESAVETILREQPAFVVLDLMLPGKDGLSIAREVRQSSRVPIMMLTAKVDEIDRLIGLEIGADDYLCKPFSPREVVARVHAILRRTDYVATRSEQKDNQLRYREVTLFKDRFICEVTRLAEDSDERLGEHASMVDLTPVEFRMLLALLEAPGRVFSRDDLMRRCYTDGRIVSDRTIDSHVKNVRRKLQEARLPERLPGSTDSVVDGALDAPSSGIADSLIHSIYGVGYKIE